MHARTYKHSHTNSEAVVARTRFQAQPKCGPASKAHAAKSGRLCQAKGAKGGRGREGEWPAEGQAVHAEGSGKRRACPARSPYDSALTQRNERARTAAASKARLGGCRRCRCTSQVTARKVTQRAPQLIPTAPAPPAAHAPGDRGQKRRLYMGAQQRSWRPWGFIRARQGSAQQRSSCSRVRNARDEWCTRHLVLATRCRRRCPAATRSLIRHYHANCAATPRFICRRTGKGAEC